MKKIILLFLLLNAVVIAKNMPSLTVTADQMTYNDKTKTSTAVGNAIATFHRAAEGIQILTADSMIEHHSVDDSNRIETLHATSTQPNYVSFQSPTLTVTAKTCHYDGKTQHIVCTGCVKIVDLKKKDTITGDKADINMQTKVYRIESFGEHMSEAIVHTNHR